MNVRGKSFYNKDYKIYRIHALTPKQQKIGRNDFLLESHQGWTKISEFKIKLINKFCDENFDELAKYTLWAKQIPYKKDWLFDQYEIGVDMLEEKYDIVAGNWRGSGWTLAIPFKHEDIIKFTDENLDSKYYKIKKRLF